MLSVRKFMLEMRGYVVKIAKSDDQAIDLLKRGNVDMVISRLPGVIDEVKKMKFLVPTVFIAGYIDLGETSADAVLSQDTQSPVEVLAVIKELFNRSKRKQ